MKPRITALNLRHSFALSITPELPHARYRFNQATGPAVPTSGSFSRDTLARGGGYQSLGHYELPLMMHPTTGRGPVNEIFVHGLVIKTPGTLAHSLPNELSHLEDLISIMAHHELASDEQMINKLGFLTVRSLTLKENEKQIAQGDWHAHKPPSRDSILKRMLALDIPQSSLFWASKIDPSVIQSEYMVSDIAGTLIQAAPAPTPLDISESDLSYNVKTPRFTYRQAEDYEIVHGNSYTFHAAAEPKAEQIGHHRTFVLLTYAPTLP
jgi:hypothetical protein